MSMKLNLFAKDCKQIQVCREREHANYQSSVGNKFWPICHLGVGAAI